MKMTMTATPIITEIDDTPVRIWEGETSRGSLCRVYVAKIELPPGSDPTEFEAELKETLPPAVWRHPLDLLREPARASLTTENAREAAEAARRWAESSEGRAAIRRGLEEARALAAEFERAGAVDPAVLR